MYVPIKEAGGGSVTRKNVEEKQWEKAKNRKSY